MLWNEFALQLEILTSSPIDLFPLSPSLHSTSSLSLQLSAFSLNVIPLTLFYSTPFFQTLCFFLNLNFQTLFLQKLFLQTLFHRTLCYQTPFYFFIPRFANFCRCGSIAYAESNRWLLICSCSCLSAMPCSRAMAFTFFCCPCFLKSFLHRFTLWFFFLNYSLNSTCPITSILLSFFLAFSPYLHLVSLPRHRISLSIERINIKTHTQYRKSKSKIASQHRRRFHILAVIFEHSTLKGKKDFWKNWIKKITHIHSTTPTEPSLFTPNQATYTEN